MKKNLLVTMALVMLLGLTARAFDTIPFQFSIWPPTMQMVPPDIAVSGLKINLPYGGNDRIVGLDLGLASTSVDASALQINLLNLVENQYKGLQIGIFNLCGNSSGLQIGALFNVTDNAASGIQIGLVNSTLEMNGLQIGIINYTQFMTGVQLGLINIISDSVLPVFPIINLCF